MRLADYPDSLLLTPPVWINPLGMDSRTRAAWGPFIFEEGKNKIVGMELYDYGTAISFSDGDRMRSFAYKEAKVEEGKVIFTNKNVTFAIRPIELEDAPEFGYNRRRPGLTKEQLINEALRAFQPRI